MHKILLKNRKIINRILLVLCFKLKIKQKYFQCTICNYFGTLFLGKQRPPEISWTQGWGSRFIVAKSVNGFLGNKDVPRVS